MLVSDARTFVAVKFDKKAGAALHYRFSSSNSGRAKSVLLNGLSVGARNVGGRINFIDLRRVNLAYSPALIKRSSQ